MSDWLVFVLETGLYWPLAGAIFLCGVWSYLPANCDRGSYIVGLLVLSLVSPFCYAALEHHRKELENQENVNKRQLNIYKEIALEIKVKHHEMIDYLEKQGVWQVVREKVGDEKELLQRQKELYDLLTRLCEVKNNVSAI